MSAGAVLFDLDGVLIDSAGSVERAWSAWAVSRGLDVEAVLATIHGRPSLEAVRLLAPDADAAAESAAIEAAQVADTAGVVAYPGAAEALGGSLDLPVAIVTSCTAALATARIAAAGLAPPDVIVTSDQLTRGKPAPDGYVLAAERLGVPAVECVVVEDAPAGVAAGRAAGMTVIAITTTHEASELAGAHEVIGDLRDITLA